MRLYIYNEIFLYLLQVFMHVLNKVMSILLICLSLVGGEQAALKQDHGLKYYFDIGKKLVYPVISNIKIVF